MVSMESVSEHESIGKIETSNMNFNDLLKKENIDPDGVLLMRHRPKDRELIACSRD